MPSGTRDDAAAEVLVHITSRQCVRAADGSDDLIVVDIASGALIDRVSTGSRIANGMFLTAGGARDVFYCSTLYLSRITWS